MRTSSAFMQIIGWVVGIIGVIAGFVQTSSGYAYSNNSGLIIVSSVCAGVLFYAPGAGLNGIADIVDASRPSADADERTAEALEYLGV